MKRILIIMMTAILVVAVLSACAPVVEEKASANIPNPVVEYKTVEEMNEVLGFDMIQLSEVLGYAPQSYAVIGKTLGQIVYGKEGAEVDINVRMAKDDEDISGVYGAEYDKENVNKMSVNMGTYNNIMVAWFLNGEHTYAVSATGVENVDFKAIVKDVAAMAVEIK